MAAEPSVLTGTPGGMGRCQAAQALRLGGGESELSFSNEDGDSSPSKSPSAASRWRPAGGCNLRLAMGNCEK